MRQCLFIKEQQCEAPAAWSIYPMDAPPEMWTESCGNHLDDMLSGSEQGFMVYPERSR
jgi:hypothetical protein